MRDDYNDDGDGRDALLDELFRHFWPRLFRYASKLCRDREVARELSSEAFTRLCVAFRNRKAPPLESCEKWLRVVVRNLCFARTRSADASLRVLRPAAAPSTDETAVDVDGFAGDPDSLGRSPEDRLLDEATAARTRSRQADVARAITTLPDGLRKVVERKLQGQHSAEIAREFGVTESVVNTRYSRALDRIAAWFGIRRGSKKGDN